MYATYKIIDQVEIQMSKLKDRERIEFLQEIIDTLQYQLDELFDEEATLGDEDEDE